jgi:chromosome partitioning protein
MGTMPARIITIAQQKGGAGKTTLAAHLALAWHEMGESVALVDIDPQGSLSRWFQARQAALGPGEAGVSVATVTGWRASGEIERLGAKHSLIVIDSPPHAETEAKMAIRSAHLVVVPVQPSPLDLWATRPTVEIAAAERVPLILVLNRVPARNPLKEEVEQALAELSAPVAKARLGNRSALSASMATGRSVGEAAPDSQAAKEVARLGRELLGLAKAR